eukprot:36130-Eustigmatos_ZCMA.PRE.1
MSCAWPWGMRACSPGSQICVHVRFQPRVAMGHEGVLPGSQVRFLFLGLQIGMQCGIGGACLLFVSHPVSARLQLSLLVSN